MKQIYVQVGFRKLKAYLVREENEKYVVELEDGSEVVVDEIEEVK